MPRKTAPHPEQAKRVEGRTAALAAFGLVLLLIAAAIGGWLWLRARGVDLGSMSTADVEAMVRSWAPWSWLGSIALMVLHSFVPLPAEIIALANGMLFGPWWGVAVTWVGAMLGAILAYGLARALGRPAVRGLIPARHWTKLDAIPMRAGPLLVIRLMPVISFNLVNYAAGLLGVPWWRFLWTTAIGILPIVVTMVVLGRELMAAPWWIWGAFALVCLALLGLLRLMRRNIGG
ncbi:MAG TPA: VTT domain-containing protein [Stellaceae bacterium]|nr:VTT domain-containing protein [Stellaceae bacterium]